MDFSRKSDEPVRERQTDKQPHNKRDGHGKIKSRQHERHAAGHLSGDLSLLGGLNVIRGWV